MSGYMDSKKENKRVIDTTVAMLPIGAIAQSLNVHQRTLRIYDKEGILSPKRTAKNRRLYSLDDLEKAKLILFLTRNLALNLSGVRVVLAVLEQNNVEPNNYINYIKNVANTAGINELIQDTNVEKTSKRGRKAKEK